MESIKIDDFINFNFISGLEYSEDGKHACFAVHKADLEENDYDTNLWIYKSDSDQCTQLTAFNKEQRFIWLTDNEHIVFMGMRDPKDKKRQEQGEVFTVFYRINIHGGEAEKFFEVPFKVSQIEQIDTANFLLLGVYNPHKPADLTGIDDLKKAEVLKQQKEEQDYEILEEIPFWSNGVGFVSGNRTRLYSYNIESNTLEPLTDELLDVSTVVLNHKRNQAAFIGQVFQGKRQIENAVYLLDLAAKEVQPVSNPAGFRYYQVEFMNQNQLIGLGTDGKRYGLNENPRFFLIDINTGSQKIITPELDVSIGNSIGSDCRFGTSSSVKKSGDYLYFITTEGTGTVFNRIDAEGKIKKITAGIGTVDSFAVHNNNILLVRLKPNQLQEVYKLEQNQEKQITHFNDWFTFDRSIAELESCNYQVNDKIEIDGWVIKPIGWDESKRYPAILDIHGGPKIAYGEVYYHEMQYWVNQGYFVMLCNPRGSDGKGDEFADIRGKYGTIDYEDLMGFVDVVLERYPSIDQNRLGVTGGSYGGFMTNWIIGHTDRFKAAASQRSIANWVSMGCTTDIGYYFSDDQIGTTPWEDADKLWEASPLKYADKVKTPTLFIHSEQDYRCWLVEGLQMFTALKYHGVESRLCMFRGENHDLSRSGKPQQRIRRLREITDWFDRYLKPQ